MEKIAKSTILLYCVHTQLFTHWLPSPQNLPIGETAN